MNWKNIWRKTLLILILGYSVTGCGVYYTGHLDEWRKSLPEQPIDLECCCERKGYYNDY